MWIFGIMESILSDPLFAGRLVSVVTGFLTLIGIFKLTKYLFGQKAALISSFLYTIIPIFSFYDRQALMESSVATIGIWTCYFLLKGLKENSLRNSVFAGLVLGIGFFIKSSSFVYFVSYIALVLTYLLISKRVKIVANLLAALAVFIGSISLLIINPQFWNTIQSNSRYSLTINELLTFPLGKWLQSFSANVEIGFFYITPLLFLLSLVGIIIILAKRDVFKNLFLSFFLFSFLITTLLVRVPTDRYIVSFLPFLVIPSSYLIVWAIDKNKFLGIGFFLAVFIIPFGLTSLQIASPVEYLLLTGRYSRYNNMNYLQSFTSGYGVDETVSYFYNLSKSEHIIISVGENTGNPESAIFTYFNNFPNAQAVYLDSKLLGPSLVSHDCLRSDTPLYFVAREEQLVGLDKFLQKIKTIKNPYGVNTIGIYTLKKDCKGKTFKLQVFSA
jgi:hypothetical protein